MTPQQAPSDSWPWRSSCPRGFCAMATSGTRLSTRCLSHQDVVHTGSALLAPDTRAAWEQIQRGEAGVAQLLRHFEAYFSNVAHNLRRTYLRPFVLVTANMSECGWPARKAAGVSLGPAWSCVCKMTEWPWPCPQGARSTVTYTAIPRPGVAKALPLVCGAQHGDPAVRLGGWGCTQPPRVTAMGTDTGGTW